MEEGNVTNVAAAGVVDREFIYRIVRVSCDFCCFLLLCCVVCFVLYVWMLRCLDFQNCVLCVCVRGLDVLFCVFFFCF